MQNEDKPFAGLSALVVDDSPTLRNLLRPVLEALAPGLRVHEAADGERGLAVFMTRRPDLIFLDVNMPGCNGIELLRAIRQVDRRCVVFLLSGDAAGDWQEQAGRFGIHGYLEKPFDRDMIVRALDLFARLKRPAKAAPPPADKVAIPA